MDQQIINDIAGLTAWIGMVVATGLIHQVFFTRSTKSNRRKP